VGTTDAWLLDHRSDVHSQGGEDGVIGKILEILPPGDKWCVEFGAWDGRHLSNTWNLIENKGFSAVLIEGNPEKFGELRKNCSAFRNVVPLNRFVGFAEKDGLDAILAETPIPRDFDFLSIDIDGNDYHVWKAVSSYRPKAVCIEFNPTIPTEVHFVQDADPSVSHGNSLRALTELGKSKGYELVSVLPINAIFVRSEYFHLFGIRDNRPEALRKDADLVTHLFSGYDGRVFLRGGRKLPWHGVELKESEFQPLPEFLRRFPGEYTRVKRLFFAAHCFLRRLSPSR
jgi:hypothetical protein